MRSTQPVFRLAVAMGGLLLTGSAWAAAVVSTFTPQVTVEVATRVENKMANDALTTDGSLVFGTSEASPLGATAKVKEGDPWMHPCAVAHCGALSSQIAYAKGEINAELGRFKALTSLGMLSAGGAAQVILGQADVVTFDVSAFIKTPQLKLHVAMDSRAGHSGELRGYSIFEFAVYLSRLDCPAEDFPDGCDNQVFFFHGQDYAGSDLDSWFVTGQDNVLLAEGNRVPDGGLDIVLDLFDLRGHALAIGQEYGLGMLSRTYSECSERSDPLLEGSCSTYLDASHTAYVGITELATSTYSYPGAPTGDPGNRVPEPASLPLVLAALGLVALGGRRGRRIDR